MGNRDTTKIMAIAPGVLPPNMVKWQFLHFYFFLPSKYRAPVEGFGRFLRFMAQTTRFGVWEWLLRVAVTTNFKIVFCSDNR